MNKTLSQNLPAAHNIFEGHFGLEKESLRTTPTGHLAHTKHPFPDNSNLDRDFCENQLEIITDVCASIEEVYSQLTNLHKAAVRRLYHMESGTEYIWPFSNPPYVKGEDDIPIATYEGTMKGKERYRRYLADKYGKKKMLFSGIHFNFSFTDEFIEDAWKLSDVPSYRAYKDSLYLDLAKKVAKNSWLVVYLTAASPVMDGSFFKDEAADKVILSRYSSGRCSEIGYWNDFIPLLEYDTLDNYVQSIQSYVDSGQLKAATELYYPVRLKPRGENSLENLKASGINHIELRTLDLNPLSPIGIMKEDIHFLHLFLVYLAFQERAEFDTLEQVMAIKNEKRAALYEEKDIWIEKSWNSVLTIHDAAMEILEDMERFYEEFRFSSGKNEKSKGENPKGIFSCISYQKEKILYPQNRYAVRLRKEFRKDYVPRGIQLAKKYADEIAGEETSYV